MTSQSPLICIDGRLVDQPDTGVSLYASTLIGAVARAGRRPLLLGDGGADHQRSRFAKLVAAAKPMARRLELVPDGFRGRDIFREAQVHFDLFREPITLAAPGLPGLMHWTYPLPLRIAGWRNLYTVHDLIPLDPSLASPVDGPRLERLLRRLARDADRLVAVSETVRAAIVAQLNWTPERVALCPQGVDVEKVARGSLPLGLVPGRYFLFVGALEHRKNLARLISAYRASGVGTPLVIAGPDGGASAAVEAATSESVLRLPYQQRADTLRLIADARALLFPSLAEGFGLPIAEAMALGTPVLTSSGGATEEVAGGAALLVDPRDANAIARGIARLDADPTLRLNLSTAGTGRARAFAIDDYGERLLRLYDEVWHDR